MTENRGPDPKPPEDREPDPQPPENRGPDPQPPEDRGPDPQPPEDDIRWLSYLGIGLLLFLGLVAWSGFHNAMGH
jgi:hypothetical protein